MTAAAPLHITLLKQRFICGLIFLLSLFFYSCKRNRDSDVSKNNNKVNATVVLTSGTSIIINATGTKATAVKDIINRYTYIRGVNDANAGVYISFQNVTTPGTYPYSCEYWVNTISQATPVYINTSSFVTNSGNVTITAITDHHIEGTFTATCKTHMSATDSAAVTGSFKADY